MGKFKHGLSGTRTHRIWKAMKRRCNNPNLTAYPNYGGRGIKVCEEWNEFIEFHKWAITNGYSDDLTLDRINNDEDYSPSNCRWTDRLTQSYNQRTTVLADVHGEYRTLHELSQLSNISTKTLNMRYLRGDRGERLIRTLEHRGVRA